MDIPRWAPWVAGGIVVYLVFRSSSGARSAMAVVPGGASSPALRNDLSDREKAAQVLQLDQLQKQATYNDALRALDLRVRYAQSNAVLSYADFYEKLAATGKYSPGYRCPGGGKPRIDPMSGGVVCMNTNQSGGFFTPFVNTVQTFANDFLKGWLGTIAPAPPTRPAPHGSSLPPASGSWNTGVLTV